MLYACLEDAEVITDDLPLEGIDEVPEVVLARLDDIETIDNEISEIEAQSLPESEDIQALESMIQSMDMLGLGVASMEAYGLRPATLALIDPNGLLSKHVETIPSVESLSATMADGYAPDAPETLASMEGVLGAIKDIAARWAAKAWNTVTGFLDRVVGWAKKLAEKITSGAKWAAGKVWDAAKAAGRVIKAHPYATAAAAAGAFVALPSILNTIWGTPLPSTHVAMGKWVAGLKTAVKKWNVPGKSVQMYEDGKAKIASAAVTVQSKSATALNWTGDKLTSLRKTVVDALSGGWGRMVDFLKGAAKKLFGKAGTDFNEAGDTKYVEAGILRKAAMNLISLTWRLITGTLSGAGSILRTCFSAVGSLFVGKGEGAAAAATA